MFSKKCEFCKEEIIVKYSFQKFCNRLCRRRKYESNPEFKKKRNFLERTRYKDRRQRYWKEYFSRPWVKERINKQIREKRLKDKEFAIRGRLRKALRHSIRRYTGKGKTKKSREYNIDWGEIIESLKPFPEDITKFEIDHIIPLFYFNLSDPLEIKKAFDPSNLQWLTPEENRRKGRKIQI